MYILLIISLNIYTILLLYKFNYLFAIINTVYFIYLYECN